MAKSYPANWNQSAAGKRAKPGFGGKDTRMISGGKAEGISLADGSAAPGISVTHGPAAGGVSPLRGGKVKGIGLRGNR